MDDEKLESLLSWFEETKEEQKVIEARRKALEKQILDHAKENGICGAVRFDYAGRYFEASLNIDRIRTKLPSKKEVIEQFRKMLPEGKQTAEEAQKLYDSLTSEASMTDSVTVKAVDPPKEVIEAKVKQLQEELKTGE